MGLAFQFKLDADAFKQALEKSPELLQSNMRIAMKSSMRDVKEEAQATHDFTSRSGNLERSIVDSVNNAGTVGKVKLDTAIAPYGPYQHEGTKRHPIAPTKKKALRFVSGGKFGFSKGHNVKGINRDSFLVEAMIRKGSSIQARLTKAVTDTLKAVGFK